MKSRVSASMVLASMVLAGVATSSAAAAEIRAVEGANGTILTLTGEIARGDDATFERLAEAARAGSRVIVVRLTSTGGDLVTSLRIGMEARRVGASTYVDDGGICMSGCALAWLGGARRFVSESGHLGYHAAYDTVTKKVTSEGYALTAAYLADVGVDQRFLGFIYARRLGQGVDWLTPEIAREYGVAMDVTPSQVDPMTIGTTAFYDKADESEAAYRAGGTPALGLFVQKSYDAFDAEPTLRGAFQCFSRELAASQAETRWAATEGREPLAAFSDKAWQQRVLDALMRLGRDRDDAVRMINVWIALNNRTVDAQR